MSTNRANQALLSRIANTVVKEFGRDDLYVAQAPVTVSLSDAHLKLLQQLEQDRLNDPTSVARLVELSRIVDCIQDRSGTIVMPTQELGYLSDVFRRVINNIEFHSAPMSDEEQHRYEQALAILYEEYPLLKTKVYHEFCLLRVELAKKDVVLLEMRQNLLHTQDSKARSLLESEIAILQQLNDKQQEVLDALDRAYSFRTAESIVEAAARAVDQIPQSISTMLDTIELLYIQDPITGDQHVACSFFPDHLSQDQWAPLQLTHEEIMQALPADHGDPTAPNELDETEIELIELEVQSILCARAWFWSEIFDNPHWGWRTPLPSISTGEDSASEEELIPAYIYGLIFARNLKIKGRSSAQSHFNSVEVNSNVISNFLMRMLKPVDLTPVELRPEVTLNNNLNPAILQPLEPHQSAELDLGAESIPPQFYSPAVGQVVDEHGNGIYQVSVSLDYKIVVDQLLIDAAILESKPELYQVLTDEKGWFSFTLRAGQYPVNLEKEGFVTKQDILHVFPLEEPITQVFHMWQENLCYLPIHLVERVENVDKPFSGQVKIVIKGDNYERIEVVDGQSEYQLRLPAGNFTITVVSTESIEILPSNQQITLHSGDITGPTLTYTIIRAPILSNPEIQLLGFICRKVPRCPKG